MITIDLSTTFNLNNSPEDIRISDLFNYLPEGYTTPKVSGIFKITSPIGMVFYNNTSWLNSDIDLDNASKLVTKSGIVLPKNALGKVLQGVYTINYTLALSTATTSRVIASSVPALKKIILTGNFVAEINTSANHYVTGGASAGGFSISSVTLNVITGDTEIIFNEAFTALAGNFVYSLAGQFTTLALSTTYYYCEVLPVADIDVSHDCRYSLMVVDDDTNYNIIVSGINVIPDSKTRVMTINYPVYTGISPLVTALQSYTLGPNIWESREDDDYIITLSVAVTWTYPDDLIVIDTVSGSTTRRVICNTCECDMFQCVVNLWNRYYEQRGINNREAERLWVIVSEAMVAYSMYQYALSCGGDYAEYCEKISELALSEDCQCTSTDPGTGEIIPTLYSISSSSCDCPDITFGRDNVPVIIKPPKSLYINLNNYDLWQYISSVWVLQGNIKGTTGSTGTAGSDGTAILYYDFDADTHTGAGIEILKSYSFPTTYFNQNGNGVKIFAQYDIPVNVSGTAYITLDGSNLGGTFDILSSVVTSLFFEINIWRSDTNKLRGSAKITRKDGSDHTIFTSTQTFENDNFTLTKVISGNWDINCVANTPKPNVVCNLLVIEFDKAI